MTPQLDIAIIGAGLGGLAAAATLLQRGHRVRIAEQAPVLGEVGAGIQMSANAMKVLDRLGLRATLDARAVRPKAFEFRRFNDGELLHRLCGAMELGKGWLFAESVGDPQVWTIVAAHDASGEGNSS
jgi:2-polyprenyl-6-methoxyphenol hydroxylase-like FAD-dependent oxidoreductase